MAQPASGAWRTLQPAGLHWLKACACCCMEVQSEPVCHANGCVVETPLHSRWHN